MRNLVLYIPSIETGGVEKNLFYIMDYFHNKFDKIYLVTSSKIKAKKINNKIIQIHPKTNFFCEPNMGKRNLYPTISKKFTYTDSKTRMDIIAFSDGKTSLFKIAELINKPLKKIIEECKILKKNKIIS